MANQVIVTNTGNVQVALTPPPNVQVQISRAAIGTVSNVPTANFANYAANVTSSSQPNITSLGTLTALNVSGNGTVNNLTVTGNLSVGNLFANNANFANFAGEAFNVSGSNVTGAVANATYANAANTANLATYATTANSVAGANVSGTVANATFALDAGNSNLANTANSVALANVVGIGNIANINLDGNSSNVLYGNGVFATISIPAGDQISNGTSNVSIPVANGNIQVYANNQHWTFTDVGNLLLAGGNGVVQSIANSSLDPIVPNVSTMVLTPDQGYTSQALVLDPTTPGHIHLRAPGSNIDQPQANVYLGGEASSFEVGIFNGAVPNLFIHSNNNTWMFDITGNLTLPGNIFAVNYANGTQVPLDGPVANANYANFAGTAYSVDGANVSGEVANANYSSYANIAASANSVALANVVGIGNIANINLDGSSSNVLFGNGVFAPESTSIANANYANFAGNALVLANGTSNISIPVANGNAIVSIAGNANVITIDGNGSMFITPKAGGYNNFIRMEGFGRSGNVGGQRVSWQRARGNITTPLSLQPNDVLGELFWYGHNGANYQTSSISRIQSLVDNSYTANGTNIPLGIQIQVNDTNGGTNNQLKTHSFWANGNVVLNSSLDVPGNIYAYTGNITANTGVFVGNGSGLTNLTGANVTGTVANATYAANAGYAVDSGTAAVANSVAVANVVGIGNIAVVNLDGNASNVLLGNGVFSSVPVTIPTSIANGTSNITIPTASSNILISTAGNANVVDIRAEGTFGLKPPPQGPLNALRIDTYGRSGNQGAQRINSTRYRGNATTPLSVQPGDATMELLTVGYNGSAIQTSSIARIQSIVDSSYTANGTNIPLGWQVQVNDTNGGVNNQVKTHNFYANGVTALAGSLSVTGNITGANLITGNITANGGTYSFSNSTGGRTTLAITGDKTTNSGVSIDNAQFSVTMSNVDATTGFSPFRFTQYAPTNNQFSSMFMYRARGDDFFTQTPVVAGDSVVRIVPSINSNNTFASIGGFFSDVSYNDNAGNTAGLTTISAVGSGTTGYLNSIIALDANTTAANNISANTVSVGTGSNNITLNGTTGYITYNKSFGNFTSNVTQTNSNVGNAVYMTLNNNEGSNGVSIVSNSQITTSRTGNYNIQFSAQMEKTDGGTDAVEIWLTKNGSSVANSATRLQIQGTNEKDVAAWNWLVNSANVNDYYQIAWASTDANMQLVAIGSGSTLSGVAVPSLIVTVVPVGA
jgi:hypothetical protein